jgi:hypothetical protein
VYNKCITNIEVFEIFPKKIMPPQNEEAKVLFQFVLSMTASVRLAQ